jgi:hypothetical protein
VIVRQRGLRTVQVMPSPLFARLGLGSDRAVANARHEMLRHDREQRIVAELVAALARHGAPTARPVGPEGRTTAPVEPAA